jgi:hypothetical protein
MAILELKGRITASGELKVDLPDGLPPGETRVTIEVPLDREWTSEDLDDALKIVPLTGAEIVQAGLLGGWADEGIADGETWVEELRQKRREQRSW